MCTSFKDESVQSRSSGGELSHSLGSDGSKSIIFLLVNVRTNSQLGCVLMSPNAHVMVLPIFWFSDEARIHLKQQEKSEVMSYSILSMAFIPLIKIMPSCECMMLSRDGLVNCILTGRDCRHFYK